MKMAVSEYERTQLFNWFEEHMGTERASTMMNLLPPVGWGDVATRRDLELLEERLVGKTESEAGRLDGKIDLLAQQLDGKIDLLAQQLDGKIDLRAQQLDDKIDILAQRLDGRIDRLEDRLEDRLDGISATMATRTDLADSQRELGRTFVTWLFMAQATVVAAVGLLIAYLG
jgi:hypothetical protein